ncbi:LysR family transcriptional regulator [uncultured Martelella sp.]|uniref:LysR family transcriptional regulator n=1 Tax=uncultured Martelella sp. TaxID=392331 RepID=UPI0029C82C60|nr:LysR family transcriptional regulator [uncultured Martelella sp.]
MLDQITHLFRLQAIIKEGSLRQAAERLHITQPALSRSLAQLENYFGQPLVERHARGVRPTLFGLKVRSASLRLMRQWELTDEELRTEGRAGRIHLRIGAGPVWRTVILPEVMLRMQRRFPKMVFEIHRAHPTDSYEDLSEGRLDVILSGISAENRFPRLVQKQLGVVNNLIVAREGHPVFDRVDAEGRVPSEALLDYPWLVYTEYQTYREITMHAIHERLGQPPEIALVCDSLNTALASLQRGDYLSLLPEPITMAAVSPRLVPVPVGLTRREVKIGMVIREEAAGWEPVQALGEASGEVLQGLSFS